MIAGPEMGQSVPGRSGRKVYGSEEAFSSQFGEPMSARHIGTQRGDEAMRSTTRMVTALIAVMALTVAACGSASDEAAEQAVEELIEASSGGDVDVNISGDGDDVTIEMETEDGSVSIGVGTELPDELDIPVPDGGDVMTSFVSDDGISVSLSYAGDRFDEIYGFYEDWTSSTGDEWERQTLNMESDEGTIRNTMWVEGSGDSAINLSDCAAMGLVTDDDAAVCVIISQGG